MAKSYALEFKNVSKVYTLGNGEVREALKDITFSQKHNEFISLIGPSGCGKSTLIKLAAGLNSPTSGQIFEEGGILKHVRKDQGVMFQQYNLFPWLTVEKNIAFGLTLARASQKKSSVIIAHYIEVMGLQKFEHAYPKELSGGMQQRVALGRTLATNPHILLMDEPFSALDLQTKRSMHDLLLRILDHEPRTVMFVTHDYEEAVFLSDTIYVLSSHPGTIQEKIKVNLARPREARIEFSPEFMKIKKHLQEVITQESCPLPKLNVNIYAKEVD